MASTAIATAGSMINCLFREGDFLLLSTGVSAPVDLLPEVEPDFLCVGKIEETSNNN